MDIRSALEKIEYRYNLISNEIYHKRFDELSKRGKEKVIYSYNKYY